MVARLGLIASSDQLGVNVCVHSFLSLWIMSESPTMIRLLSASVASARRAGQICREVLSSGKLGVVDKVRREGGRGRARERAPNYFDTCNYCPRSIWFKFNWFKADIQKHASVSIA